MVTAAGESPSLASDLSKPARTGGATVAAKANVKTIPKFSKCHNVSSSQLGLRITLWLSVRL